MWVSGWDHVLTNSSLTPTHAISAYRFLALSHQKDQKRLPPDIFLLPGFCRTCVLHTALTSTALESRAKMHKCIRFKWKGIGVDEFSVWNSRKGYMEKEFLMHPVKIFKVHFWISVETAWHLDTKKESKVCCYIPFYFSYFHCLLKIRHRFAQYNEVTNRKVISALKIRVPTVTQK